MFEVEADLFDGFGDFFRILLGRVRSGVMRANGCGGLEFRRRGRNIALDGERVVPFGRKIDLGRNVGRFAGSCDNASLIGVHCRVAVISGIASAACWEGVAAVAGIEETTSTAERPS